MSRLEWHGDAIVGRIVRTATRETTRTADLAVASARGRAPVETGEYREGIKRFTGGLETQWGGAAPHSIWIEIGAQGRAPNPVLRSAADDTYPRLAPAIARGWPNG